MSMLKHDTFFKVDHSQVQSYGDFVIMCLPNNLWISVKSNFARERLLASGFSTDIIGVGFFEDPTEFSSYVKIRNFQRAGFLAMYCPDIAVTTKQVQNNTSTYEEVIKAYTGRDMPLNINGKPFIRPLSHLKKHLDKLLVEQDVRRRFIVDF